MILLMPIHQAYMALLDIDSAVESFKKALVLEPNDSQYINTINFPLSLIITFSIKLSLRCFLHFLLCRWYKEGACCCKEEG